MHLAMKKKVYLDPYMRWLIISFIHLTNFVRIKWTQIFLVVQNNFFAHTLALYAVE